MKFRITREQGGLRWWLIRDPEHRYIMLAHGQLAWRNRLGGVWLGFSDRDDPEWHASMAVMPLYASVAIRAPTWARLGRGRDGHRGHDGHGRHDRLERLIEAKMLPPPSAA